MSWTPALRECRCPCTGSAVCSAGALSEGRRTVPGWSSRRTPTHAVDHRLRRGSGRRKPGAATPPSSGRGPPASSSSVPAGHATRPDSRADAHGSKPTSLDATSWPSKHQHPWCSAPPQQPVPAVAHRAELRSWAPRAAGSTTHGGARTNRRRCG